MLIQTLEQQKQQPQTQSRSRRFAPMRRPFGEFTPAQESNDARLAQQQAWNQQANATNAARKSDSEIAAADTAMRQAYMEQKQQEKAMMRSADVLGVPYQMNMGGISGGERLPGTNLTPGSLQMEQLKNRFARLPIEEQAKAYEAGGVPWLQGEEGDKFMAGYTKHQQGVQHTQNSAAAENVLSGKWFPKKVNGEIKWFEKVRNPNASELDPLAPSYVEAPLGIPQLAFLAKAKSAGYVDVDSIYNMLNKGDVQQPATVTDANAIANAVTPMATPKGENILGKKKRRELEAIPTSEAYAQPSTLGALGSYMGQNDWMRGSPIVNAVRNIPEDIGYTVKGIGQKAVGALNEVANFGRGMAGMEQIPYNPNPNPLPYDPTLMQQATPEWMDMRKDAAMKQRELGYPDPIPKPYSSNPSYFGE